MTALLHQRKVAFLAALPRIVFLRPGIGEVSCRIGTLVLDSGEVSIWIAKKLTETNRHYDIWEVTSRSLVSMENVSRERTLHSTLSEWRLGCASVERRVISRKRSRR